MTNFADTLAMLAPDGDGYRIETPGDWAQGRTLYGGMTAALCYRAAMRAFAVEAPLRTAQFTFVGPASGSLVLRPAMLRRGRSATIVAVDCMAADQIAARATFAFGAGRESAIRHDLTAGIEMPPPGGCAPFYRSAKPLPGFLANFEYRLAAGARILEPGAAPAFTVWTRFREGCGDDPVAAILAITDALPCAAMVAFPKLAPVSTLSWSVDFHGPLAAGQEWYLIGSASESAADGYSLQAMRVHDEAGTPLVTARQVVAIFA